MMRTFLLIAMTLFLAACGTQSETTSLEWPALNTLDLAVEELDTMLEQNVTPEQLEKHVPKVATALDAVVKGGVPSGTDNEELVKQKLAELSSLHDELQRVSSNVRNQELLRALHPLVASIMKTAGMPHVHACVSCAGCSDSKEHKHHDDGEHSHDEHDHSHEGHHDHDH